MGCDWRAAFRPPFCLRGKCGPRACVTLTTFQCVVLEVDNHDPKFGWKSVKTKQKLTIAPDPNNSVGLVWIDLIHGTPELLTLNPGFSSVEAGEAKMPNRRAEMSTNLDGDAPLPNFIPTNPEGQEWTERLLARFDLTYKLAASKVAAINLIPYRSNQRRPRKDRHM